jgi:hypothetical protein
VALFSDTSHAANQWPRSTAMVVKEFFVVFYDIFIFWQPYFSLPISGLLFESPLRADSSPSLLPRKKTILHVPPHGFSNY